MFCKFCGKEIPENSYFCLYCGKALKDTNEEISLLKEISLYAASIFLMPLGLYWFFKYYKSTNPTKKRIAYGCLILTIIFLLVTVVITYDYFLALKSYMNTPQFKQLQML